MKMPRQFAVALLAVAAMPWAAGHDFHAGAIGVDRARAGPSTPGQREDAAYLAITNSGKADELVAVSCTVASSVELRSSAPRGPDGDARTVRSIPIPARGTLELKPDGYHLAFIALGYSFTAGERIAAKLRFASGLELPVEFEVREQ